MKNRRLYVAVALIFLTLIVAFVVEVAKPSETATSEKSSETFKVGILQYVTHEAMDRS